MFEPTIVKGMPYTTTTIVMGIVFLIIAVVFYLFRTPKEVTK
jgi:cbb3-type cytochrome oxidase subunit 3